MIKNLRQDLAKWVGSSSKKAASRLSAGDLTAAHATDPEYYWGTYGGPKTAVLLVGYAGNDFITKSTTGLSLTCLRPDDYRVTHICNVVIPQYCQLARTFFGRIVVQLGMNPADWRYEGDTAEAWKAIFERVTLAFQACGCLVVSGTHVWRLCPRASGDPIHLSCVSNSVRLVTEFLLNLVRLVVTLYPSEGWQNDQDKWLRVQIPMLLRKNQEFLQRALSIAKSGKELMDKVALPPLPVVPHTPAGVVAQGNTSRILAGILHR
jgi:hypothetical protein